ncbi:MAG: DUF2793 domain-containing protein [Erythrobacter sp.]|nr:MAG: DUF2793 domain-containing protein [Erythrobacter sp.]
MTDPIAFASATPRYALPQLFVAQAQKELTLNEALARIDGLLHPVAEGEADAPPASPADGECWIVGTAPTGDWSGQSGAIALRQAGNWLFVAPREGTSVYDRAAGSMARYDSGWQRNSAISAPSGGTFTDVEARAAIAGLIAALAVAGIVPEI